MASFSGSDDTETDNSNRDSNGPTDTSECSSGSESPSHSLKVLITGGCGFLGRHIGRRVFESLPSDTVIMLLDSNGAGARAAIQMIDPNVRDEKTHERIKLKIVDITNRRDLCDVFNQFQPNVVFHCAGLSELSATIDDKLMCDRMQKINEQGTRHVVHACQTSGVEVLIYTGSLAQVLPNERQKSRLKVDEFYVNPTTSNLLAHSYGQSKQRGEEIVLTAARSRNGSLRACSIRCPPLYGECDTSFIPNVVLAAQKYFGLYPHCGDSTYSMEAMYVENAAHAHLCAARKLMGNESIREKVNGRFFYVGDDTPKQWAVQFYMSFLGRLGFKSLPSIRMPIVIATILFYIFVCIILFIHVFFDSNVPSPILNYRRQIKVLAVDHCVDWDRARRFLGYSPLVDYQTGFNRSIAHYQAL